MGDPLVSILIPSYKPRHFEIALTSAIAQAYDNKEIIVSDDCPSEEIANICDRYPQVKYSRNPDSFLPHRTPNSNLCRLTELAGGEYLKYLLDDDILHPLCVRRMVDALASDPSIKLVFSPRDRIDAHNRLLSQERAISIEGPMRRIAGTMLRKVCTKGLINIFGEFTTVMFRKSDVIGPDGGPIYITYHGHHIEGLTDIATFLQLCERGDAIYIADALSLFRIHPEANTNQRASRGVMRGLSEWALFVEQACRDADFSGAERLETVMAAREKMGSWAQLFPHLTAELDRLGQLMESLEAGSRSTGKA